jgi:hypothetical protein
MTPKPAPAERWYKISDSRLKKISMLERYSPSMKYQLSKVRANPCTPTQVSGYIILPDELTDLMAFGCVRDSPLAKDVATRPYTPTALPESAIREIIVEVMRRISKLQELEHGLPNAERNYLAGDFYNIITKHIQPTASDKCMIGLTADECEEVLKRDVTKAVAKSLGASDKRIADVIEKIEERRSKISARNDETMQYLTQGNTNEAMMRAFDIAIAPLRGVK